MFDFQFINFSLNRSSDSDSKTLNQHYIAIMQRLMISLLLLTGGAQLIISILFSGSLDIASKYVAFLPAYVILLCTYLSLLSKKLKLAVNIFLVGMIIAQFLVMVYIEQNPRVLSYRRLLFVRQRQFQSDPSENFFVFQDS